MKANITGIRDKDKKAIAETLNCLENRHGSRRDAVAGIIEELSLMARPERHVIGITGPPGVGKSTMMSRIVQEYRSSGRTVGVISVDPSSRVTGGALLGDRARIAYDPSDEGIFIRSMAAGTHLGGLAERTRYCLVVFEAVYDVIVIETVGVGQSETEIDLVADTVSFVVQPGSGDVLQFMKAGIMEIPHVVVVNKADQKMLAARARQDLMVARAYSQSLMNGWQLDVVMMSALEGWGHHELVGAFDRHRLHLVETGFLERRRRNSRIEWIMQLARERFGSFGIERLGGEEEVRNAVLRQSNVSNPFAILSEFEGDIIGTGAAQPEASEKVRKLRHL